MIETSIGAYYQYISFEMTSKLIYTCLLRRLNEDKYLSHPITNSITPYEKIPLNVCCSNIK